LLRVCKLIYTVMENNSGETACHLVQMSDWAPISPLFSLSISPSSL
jgi:hypothetical protein